MTGLDMVRTVEDMQVAGVLTEDDVRGLARAILLAAGYSIVSKETAAELARIESYPHIASAAEIQNLLYALRSGQSDYWASKAAMVRAYA
jgi:hypothetical protein